MPGSKRIERPKVRNLIAGQEYIVGTELESRFHLPATHISDQITVEQHLEHHLRMIGGLAFFLVPGIDLIKVQLLDDGIDDPGRMVVFKQS